MCAFQSGRNSSADCRSSSDSMLVSCASTARTARSRQIVASISASCWSGMVARWRAWRSSSTSVARASSSNGFRPLPPAAQVVERRGEFGAFCHRCVHPQARVPDLLADRLAPGMVFEPRGDELLRARRQLRPHRKAPSPARSSRRSGVFAGSCRLTRPNASKGEGSDNVMSMSVCTYRWQARQSTFSTRRARS